MSIVLDLALVRALTFCFGLAIGISPAFAGAEPVAKWCAGTKIAAFSGGPEGADFAVNIVNGFRQAELDLGPAVTIMSSDWDPNKMLNQIKDATAAKVDGVAAFGFAGDGATDPLIDKVFAQHGIFTSIHTALPKAAARYAGAGMGQVGAAAYKLGFALAAEAALRAKLVKGDEALVWGLKGLGGERAQRTIGVLDALAKAGAKVTYQEIDAATNASPSSGIATFADLLHKNPKFKLVVTDHAGLTANAIALAKAADLKPGQIFFAGFDLSPDTVAAISQGYENLVIDQQPYLMGYLSVLDICLAHKFGFTGLDVSTLGAFVDAKNVDAIAPLALQHIR